VNEVLLMAYLNQRAQMSNLKLDRELQPAITEMTAIHKIVARIISKVRKIK